MVSSKSPYPETQSTNYTLFFSWVSSSDSEWSTIKFRTYFGRSHTSNPFENSNLFPISCRLWGTVPKSSSFEVPLNRSLKKLIKTCKLSRLVPTFSIETNRNQPKESIKISCIINVISNLNGPTSSKIKIVFLITFQLAKIFSGNKQKNEEKGRELPVRLRLV